MGCKRAAMWDIKNELRIQMKKLDIAPDFELKDTKGDTVHLSDYRDKKFVVLSFLRGFA